MLPRPSSVCGLHIRGHARRRAVGGRRWRLLRASWPAPPRLSAHCDPARSSSLALAVSRSAPIAVDCRCRRLVGRVCRAAGVLDCAQRSRSGVATLSSLAGINWLHSRAAGTLAIRDPGGIDANLVRRRDELEQVACSALESRYQLPCATISWAERFRSCKCGHGVAHPPWRSRRHRTPGRARARTVDCLWRRRQPALRAHRISEPVARLVPLAYTVPLVVQWAVLGIPYWVETRWPRARAPCCSYLCMYMFGLVLGARPIFVYQWCIPLYAIPCGGGCCMPRVLVVRRGGEFQPPSGGRVRRPARTFFSAASYIGSRASRRLKD